MEIMLPVFFISISSYGFTGRNSFGIWTAMLFPFLNNSAVATIFPPFGIFLIRYNIFCFKAIGYSNFYFSPLSDEVSRSIRGAVGGVGVVPRFFSCGYILFAFGVWGSIILLEGGEFSIFCDWGFI
jgi:hypothetical protein